jgi:ABC-type transporter Mla MlaB component
VHSGENASFVPARRVPEPQRHRAAIVVMAKPGGPTGAGQSRRRHLVEVLTLTGHLTEDSLARALEPVTADIERGCTVALLIDCLKMTGYDSAARALFVTWNGRFRGSVVHVAIVTDNSLWHMLVSAMALASGRSMRVYDRLADAQAWLGLQAIACRLLPVSCSSGRSAMETPAPDPRSPSGTSPRETRTVHPAAPACRGSSPPP